MKKSDINKNIATSKYVAVNAFIFAGSFSIGTIRAGFDLKSVLEISNDQPKQNAFYFIKNIEDVPVILPIEWENDRYLDNLCKEDIDLMCCNCPCSSLSQINRNASVDGKNNVHFYRLFNIFNHVKPKAFVIENAPTLVKLGFPILKDMLSKLNGSYRFTILRDKAGNHNVAMCRQRTMVVGWRRDIFKSIPFINECKVKQPTVVDVIGDLYRSTTNDHPSETVDSISCLYPYVKNGFSMMTALAYAYLEDKPGVRNDIESKMSNTNFFKEVQRIANKIENHQSFWDKSPYRVEDDGYFPSLTSVTEYLHPHQNRTLNLKELARIMNYPDEYDFTDKDGQCCIPVTQAIAQGVPANFGEYISSQVKMALDGDLEYRSNENIDVMFRDHLKHKYVEYTYDEFMNLNCLDVNNEKEKCKELKDTIV